MTLRSKIVRLAHQNPSLRPHLLPLLKTADLNLRKEKIVIPLTGGGTQELDAMVVGPWSIHKNLQGSGWAVTFTPTGQAVTTRPKSLSDAKAFLEAMIEQAPDLLHANDVGDVMKHQNLLRELMIRPPTTGRQRAYVPRVADRRLEVKQMLLDAGLVSVGERSGKAGEFFYPSRLRGMGLGGAPNRAIALGNRDVLLNVFDPRDEKWKMKDAELISAITPEKISQWAAWVVAGGARTDR